MHRTLGLAALLACCAGCSAEVPVTEAQMVGKWHCGPTRFESEDGTTILETVTEKRADHTYASTSTMVLSMREIAPEITVRDRDEGTWRLDGNVSVIAMRKAEFVSSTYPEIDAAQWRREIAPEPGETRSRILSFDGKSMTLGRGDSLWSRWFGEQTRCWRL